MLWSGYTIQQLISLALPVHTAQDTLYRESSLLLTVPHTAVECLSWKVNIQLLKIIPAFMDPEFHQCAHKSPTRHAVPQVASCRLSPEAKVQGQGSPYGACGSQSGNRRSLFLSALFLCCHYQSTNCTWSYFIHLSLMTCNLSNLQHHGIK